MVPRQTLLFLLLITIYAYAYSIPECIISDGKYYVSAVSISKKINAEVFYSPVSMIVVVKYNGKSGKFIVSKDSAIIDGELMSFGTYPILVDNDMYFPVKILKQVYNVKDDILDELTKDARVFEHKKQKTTVLNRESSPEVESNISNIESNTSEVESNIPSEANETYEVTTTTKEVIQVKNKIDTEESYYPEQLTKEIITKSIAVYSDRNGISKIGKEILGKIINSISKNDSRTLEISVLSDEDIRPSYLNASKYKMVLFLKTVNMMSEKYSGISFFFWKYGAEKEKGDLISLSNLFRNKFNDLKKDYSGILNYFIYPFEQARFVNIPCVYIELGNMTSDDDKAWFSDPDNIADFSRLLISIGEHQ